MKPEESRRAKELFWAALERDPSERDAFLRDACADDVSLRAEVEWLLASHEWQDSFLEHPAPAASPHTASEALLRRRLGSYELVRELGHGGMATVYLAQDTKHRRSVAVKVLRPEVAAALGRTRFLREIETAAHLNHPHILPLHDSGQAEGFLYYVMPYVEGESLRAKLARDGELPVDEATRILRDVVDALAYAHAHGVVHRDMKPDNVLLTGRHALVADFGIARAITAAGGDKVTETGIAVGTPAYMAPEQVAADPHVDHRADIYGVGVLAYEMLSGRLPFSAATPQAMLAAHVTEAPEPLIQHRPSVPSALNELVMRCLAKQPAERWQRAEDVLAHLEAMATPSGGITAAAGTTISWQARLLHVAGLYALASVAALGVAHILTMRLGLPDWVLSGAVVLLVVGLPIMVVTGLIERQRAITRTTSHALGAGGIRGWLTWRKALAGGGLAFGTLGVSAASYMAMRLLGVGPLGTLVASGVIQNREPVILAEFENRAADSTLGPSLTEAFRVDLSESPTVKLVDAQAIRDALERMERPPATPLAAALAREVAQRENVQTVVTGGIDPVGQGYVLSASLVVAANGHLLTAVRETADNEAALISALDRLSRKLRERIGESLRTIRASEPLEQVTTGSFGALRKYSQATRAEDEGDWERAAALYQEATTIDTGFAMAYRKLAAMLGNTAASHSAVVAAATKAVQHRDRLPEIERYLAASYYYYLAEYDPEKAVSAARSALERDPDNTLALLSLARILNEQRQWHEAESLAIRGTRLRPTYTLFGNAAIAQAGQGRYADAQTTLERFARIAPRSPSVLRMRFALESAQGDYAAAERDVRQLRTAARGSFQQAWASLSLARLDETRGELGRAERDLDDYMAISERRGLARPYLLGAVRRASLDVRHRDRPLAGLKAIAAALVRHPLNSIPPLDRPYAALAQFYAEAGRPEVAKRLLAEYEQVVPEGIRRGDSLRLAAAGAIALAEGRDQDAVLTYRAWTEAARGPTLGLFELARAFERARQPDSALALYERVVSTPHFYRIFDVAHALAPSLKRLGELYEERGGRAKAREYYGRFVDLWKDADPELQPVVRDVRGRIARLAAEP